MKTKTQILAILLMMSGMMFNINVQAAEKVMSREEAQVRVMQIRQRVKDIRAMDMSHMSATDRKAMKQELKDMKKELRQEPYIYISVGALILIIVILLLIL